MRSMMAAPRKAGRRGSCDTPAHSSGTSALHTELPSWALPGHCCLLGLATGESKQTPIP